MWLPILLFFYFLTTTEALGWKPSTCHRRRSALACAPRPQDNNVAAPTATTTAAPAPAPALAAAAARPQDNNVAAPIATAPAPAASAARPQGKGFGAPPPPPTAEELAARGQRSAQKAKYREAIKMAKKNPTVHKVVGGSGPGDEGRVDTRSPNLRASR